MKHIIGFLIGSVVSASAIYGIPAYKCHLDWQESGYQSKYEPLAGCKVQHGNGRWIPAQAIKVPL